MVDKHIEIVATELRIQPRQAAAVARLIAEGSTVPFIARYRKEATGGLDEVAIAAIRDRVAELSDLDARRESMLESLKERDLLTPELQKSLLEAETLTQLEDIYLPYRPKRRTRAMIAREKGLEPLADVLFAQQATTIPEKEALLFVDAAKGVADIDEALAGARDILAEKISEDALARSALREMYARKAIVRSKVISGKETEGAKFKDYFDWSEPVAKIPSHRMLAIRRGEEEGFLFMRMHPDEGESLAILEEQFVRGEAPAAQQVKLAVHDCFKRLLGSAIEGELRYLTKKTADEEAIKVFASNLRELLLAPALGSKSVLAIDPGFRTGCKVVCLDSQGKLLHHDVIYPGQSAARDVEAASKIQAFCKELNIEAIAIGNGTAGRETESFIRKIGLPANIAIVMVNESGASIYSASEVARREFPDLDLTVRGSVSIGRRLMDPLAELVKLDPKSIGVGQYQHDVDQTGLKRSLDDVVISCVNRVGVELNTASQELLTYVSGLGPNLAANIVAYRNENGPFPSRTALKKVPRLGPKAFEQAAGFLRIRSSTHPLDASAVHPESYPIVDQMAKDLNCTVADLVRDPELLKKINLQKYVTETVGLPTLTDIMEELAKPGRDPRKQFEIFKFQEGVNKMEDLKPGMKLPGIVTNVTAFGAFVDIGVHQDGLVHISQLTDRFVKDPAEIVKVHQKVTVTVTEVDLARKRIALSMRTNPGAGTGNGNGQRTISAPAKGATQRPAPKPPANDWFSQAMAKTKKS
ncbi:MAG: Tex family protein [Verrucomicrobiales bacterium]